MFPIHSGSAEDMKTKANNFILLKVLPVFNVSYKSLFGILVKKYQNWRYAAFDFTHTSNLWSNLQSSQGFLSTTLVPLQSAGDRYGGISFLYTYYIIFIKFRAGSESTPLPPLVLAWRTNILAKSTNKQIQSYSHVGPVLLQKVQTTCTVLLWPFSLQNLKQLLAQILWWSSHSHFSCSGSSPPTTPPRLLILIFFVRTTKWL